MIVKKNILVVEDEAFIAMHIQQVLEDEGYVVHIECNSVAKAKQYIQNNTIDLVIVDIHLNELETGIDLALYLKTNSSVPYFFLTSYSDRATLKNISATDPAGFLVKPFKSEDLISTVFLILNKFEVKNNLDEFIPYQLKQVVEYINLHLEERISIKALAELTRWDVAHFSRLFKNHFNQTPHQFILMKKMELAKLRLTTSDESLQEIAQSLGFGAYSNFFNAFKKINKLTPEKYRIQNQAIK